MPLLVIYKFWIIVIEEFIYLKLVFISKIRYRRDIINIIKAINTILLVNYIIN